MMNKYKLTNEEIIAIRDLKYNFGFIALDKVLQSEIQLLSKQLLESPKISDNIKDDIRFKLGKQSGLNNIYKIINEMQETGGL